jgi:Cu(I)/Ag(I) efflux system protein CusF
MKTFVLAAALMTGAALVHAGEMKGMEMKGDMKGMDMKGMDMSKAEKSKGTHKAIGVVKKVDAKAGTVTIDHEPVKSMSWPAMTMTFQVKDKALMEKFAANKKVEVEFEQSGKDYVITSAK